MIVLLNFVINLNNKILVFIKFYNNYEDANLSEH